MPATALPECQFQEYVPGVVCATDCLNGCQGVKAYIEIKRRERQEKLALEKKNAPPPLPSNAERDANNAKIAASIPIPDIQYRGERVKDHESDRTATGKP